MKNLVITLIALITLSVSAQTTLIKNVNIFDGTNEQLLTGHDVLIEKNLISKIGKNIKTPKDATVIDGQGKTLMPGLIDSHVHMSIYTPFAAGRQSYDPFQTTVVSVRRAEEMLLRGYTTVRDCGGYSKYLTDAINKGLIKGPRVFGAGRMISQTSGHGDMRGWNDPHPNIEGNGVTNYWERYHSTIADGPDEVLRAGRISLRNGAHFLKIFSTGGVTSEFDPLHMTQYTPEEIRAAVTAADQWKTYVTSHSFTEEGSIMAIENGVRALEHVPMISEKTMLLMKEKGIIGIMSTSVTLSPGTKENLKKNFSPASYAKAVKVVDGSAQTLKNVIKHNVKVAFGSDLVASPDQVLAYEAQGMLKEFMVLDNYKMPSVQALSGFTSVGGELLSMTGPNNPWQDGPIGVIEEGAYADILIVDGDPMKSLLVMTDDANFKVIMKDGVIYKNTLNEE